MPNINDVFPSKYLKASDLGGAQPVVTIDRVEIELVGQNKDRRPVIYFAGKSKGLVLNKTNATKITEITGSAITEEWPGAKIRLYASETHFQGELVDCLRVKAPTPNGRAIHMTKDAPANVAPKIERSEWDDGSESSPGDDDVVPF